MQLSDPLRDNAAHMTRDGEGRLGGGTTTIMDNDVPAVLSHWEDIRPDCSFSGWLWERAAGGRWRVRERRVRGKRGVTKSQQG
jgi:hypothetical protein